MLKRAVQKFLSTFGYRLVPADYQPQCGLNHFFPLLRTYGFSPRHIWDVGANRGDWTRTAICHFPDADYTLIEPQDAFETNVEDLVRLGHKIRWVNAGAGASAGVLSLYINPKDQGSTFVDIPKFRQEAVRSIDVPIRTLNEIRATLGLPVPDMLKIDAEGLDLRVLEGAGDFLGHTEIILAEASIGEPDFENSALALLQAMQAHGYRLIDITDINRSPQHGILWLCEFAFLRNSSRLFERATRY